MADQQTRANFSARDLVSPIDPNVTGTAAVSALTDAFSKGFITTDDILKRVGTRAQKKANLDDMIMQQATEDITDPSQATGRKAIAMQQEQAVARALNAGAPIPQTPEGKVDFNQLFQMVPQIAQWEREEADRVAKQEEWANEYKRYANADPTKPRNFYLSWMGDAPVPSNVFNEEGRRLRAPKLFNELFSQGAAQTQAGAAQGIAPAPAGEIVGQPIRDPGLRNIDGSERPPVAPQAVAGGAGPGTTGVAPAVQPAQPAAQAAPAAGQAAPGFFGQQGWKVAGYSESGIPIYTDATGNERVPTEAEQKAFLATGRQEVEKLMTTIEDLSQQDGRFDITGKGEGLRKWVADKLPNWVPYLGRENLANEQKLYDAASSAWIQGLLRLESGAAISVKEEQSYRDTFLPQTGDTYAVVKLKRQMRQNVANKIDMLAGRIQQMEAAGNMQEAERLRKATKPVILQEYTRGLGELASADPEAVTVEQLETLIDLRDQVQNANNTGQFTASGLPAAEAGKVGADIVQPKM